jgi:predicted dehydrogenase
MPAPIKLAIVGGRRGGSFVRALATMAEEIELQAVCDLQPAVLARWQSEHPGIRTYASFERLLAEDPCDAVVLATPWPLHARQAIAALRAGRHVMSEVIATASVEDGWALIDAVEQTGRIYMMAENYCYTRPNLMVQQMVEQGVFGETLYAEGGYLHDTRDLCFDADGGLTWRGDVKRQWNGNTYPTHSLGPVARWLGIGQHDRLATTATWMSPSRGAQAYAAARFGADHPAARPGFLVGGDMAVTTIQTVQGKLIVLKRDSASPRPHNMVHYALQGSAASYLSPRHAHEDPLIWIDGRSPGTSPSYAAEWEPLWQYAVEYEHPRWRAWGERASAFGHGGGDFFVLQDFIGAIRGTSPPCVDVYDAVTWSAIAPLSLESVRRGGAPIDVPDFRRGRVGAARG